MGDKDITTPHHGFQLCNEDKQAHSEDPLGMKVRSAGVLQRVGVIREVDFSILEGGGFHPLGGHQGGQLVC